MAKYPGKIIEELHVTRPDEPPEVFQTRDWFTESVLALRYRLETNAEAMGELSSKVNQENLI